MIVDAQLLFSDQQAVTAAAASANSVDLKKARNIGVGERLFIVVTVDVAFTDAGSDSTLTVDLQGDTTSAFGSATSSRLFTIPALAAAGNIYIAGISPDFAGNFEFLQLQYTPNNGNLSTGTVSAFMVKDISAFTAYAKNYTIS